MVGQRAGNTVADGRTGAAPRWWRGYPVAFAAALALYLASMAPGVLWQDSGLAQLRTLRRDLYGAGGLALSHPLYYALTIAFQYLPFAESAFKTNLVSVVFGAATVANVFLLLRLATGRWAGALVGTVSLAAAHTFWQHCALAEVYTLSTALLSGELLCLLQYARTHRAGWLVVLFLLNGLGISNHMLAVLSLGGYAGMTVWLLIRGRVRWSVLPLLGAVWVLGASLYLGLIVGQILAGSGLRECASSALFGKAFARNVLNLVPARRQLCNSVLYVGLNFPTPAVLLVLPGLTAALRTSKYKLWGVMLVVLLGIHLVWAVRYNVPDQYTFFIPAWVLLAVVLGLGADRFLRCRSRRWAGALLAAAALPAAVYVPLPQIARALKVNLGVGRSVPYRDDYAYFLHPWKTGYQGAERFAVEVGRMLPPGAVFLAESTTVRPIHYLQLTGRWRTDVRVFPPVRWLEDGSTDLNEQTIAGPLADGLVYVVSLQPGYCPPWLLERYSMVQEGIIYRVSGRKANGPP